MNPIAVKTNEWWDEVEMVTSLAAFALHKQRATREQYEAELARQDEITASAASHLDKIAEVVQGLADCHWFVRTSPSALQVQCYLTKPITTWGEMLPLLEALAPLGFSENGWKNEDVAATYTRVFNNTILDGRLVLALHANLPGDTDECRRIVKGYTEGWITKPEPIYGFDCSPSASQPKAVQPTERTEDGNREEISL